jgi:predicted amidohydrolase YtcJ
MTIQQAFAGFTADAAFAGGAERSVGTLEPGRWADFLLLDRDPFSIAPAELFQVQVEETWLAGRRVFVKKP